MLRKTVDGSYIDVDSDDELLRPVSLDAWKYEHVSRKSTTRRRSLVRSPSATSESEAEFEYQRKKIERERRRKADDLTKDINEEQAWKKAVLERSRRKKKLDEEPDYMKKLRRRR